MTGKFDGLAKQDVADFIKRVDGKDGQISPLDIQAFLKRRWPVLSSDARDKIVGAYAVAQKKAAANV